MRPNVYWYNVTLVNTMGVSQVVRVEKDDFPERIVELRRSREWTVCGYSAHSACAVIT